MTIARLIAAFCVALLAALIVGKLAGAELKIKPDAPENRNLPWQRVQMD